MTDAVVYIILPVHNRCAITRRFIRCLKSQSYPNYHLLLIDDGSSDGTEEMVRNEISSLVVIKGKGDWWWAGSLQQGYVWLKSHEIRQDDIVLLINDDLEFEPDFLEKALTLFRDKVKTLMLAECYSRNERELYDSGVFVDWRKLTFNRTEDPNSINCLSTRGLFLRVADFNRLGGFYPRILPHYLSDYEFTCRAHRKGYALVTEPSLKVFLDIHATGYSRFEQESFLAFLKSYFSAKSMMNPLAWTNFVLLTCPWPWKMINLLRVWMNSARFVVKTFLLSRKGRAR
jgi:GT2 family glycosyltransferase